ncbi:Phage tail sheath protein [Streptomyces sp. 3214.6]|nr:Phage tail sheath protein [Streptomyces sp. 3214.6]
MPTYMSPGVYVEEAQSGFRPIEGVGTAVASFVGFAEKGPFHEPTLVTNWSQYVQTFGEFADGTYLGLSVYGYFANGGDNAEGDPQRKTPGGTFRRQRQAAATARGVIGVTGRGAVSSPFRWTCRAELP